ncbi:hypothetical protein SAMN05444003_2322 [Cognatiyoonia sediminum]|uniref:Glycosyl transferases group 1 n=2 Tax=Cognatiyoonia sediminum TaxID=1508389 RepID=A0A1M5QUI3_9RHOB|nr:hypothetical protein SAMN05444003_2322 [Cognatiyoonia sediminum]
MPRSCKIVFAYRRGQIHMGGKMMRVDQLSQMAADMLPSDQYDVQTAFVPREDRRHKVRELIDACRGAVVIFHKSAASNIGPDTRAEIRKVAAGICVDHLDIVVGPLEKGFFDVHIVASRFAEAELVQNLNGLKPLPGTQVRHLRHHADPRLGEISAREIDNFQLGYFGMLENIADRSAFPDDMSIPDYEPTELDGFLNALPKSNLHVTVRKPFPKRSFGILPTKPFTKGFNAAVVGANVLVNTQVHDATYYLGEDYPFLIPDPSPNSVRAGIEHAREAFGSAEWQMGLDRMADMRAQVAPEKVVQELRQIVDLFG